MFVSFQGFTLKVRWGPRYNGKPGDTVKFDEWWSALKSKEISSPDTIEVGRWNLAQIVLPETPPDRLGVIIVEIATDVVSLLKPTNSP
jgi:hypothetical protein